jgi:hypothetical protein
MSKNAKSENLRFLVNNWKTVKIYVIEHFKFPPWLMFYVVEPYKLFKFY